MLINLHQNENKFIHLNLVKFRKILFTLAPITCSSIKKNSSYGIQMNKCAFPPIVDFKQKNWQQKNKLPSSKYEI